MNPGRQLERLTETLERVLLGNPHATIKSPNRLKDRTCGRLREHDVTVVFNNGHHEHITAIECKDRSRPIGLPQVEAFSQKCRDTGVHLGMMVSSKGFCRSALEKARHLGIECLSLDEVDSFDWIAPGKMKSYNRRIERVDCKLILDAECEAGIDNLIVKNPEGTELSKKNLLENVHAQVAAQMVSLDAGTHRLPIRLITDGFTVENHLTKMVYPLRRIDVVASIVVECVEVPFMNVVYRKDGVVQPIGRASIATFDLPDSTAELVFSRNPDETTTVKLVRRAKS